MASNEVIKTVVDLIAAKKHRRAVEAWQAVCSAQGKCRPCFYAPLKAAIRCASCLDSHLSYAQLQHLCACVDEAEMTQAQQSLKAWISAR